MKGAISGTGRGFALKCTKSKIGVLAKKILLMRVNVSSDTVAVFIIDFEFCQWRSAVDFS